MSELEFGGPTPQKKNTKAPVPIEIINNGIRDEKIPEQFLSVYEYDPDHCEDVIVFRKPTLRDIQVYDVCKFENGQYGIIIGIRSQTAIACGKHLYNYGAGWGNCLEYTTRTPMKLPKFYPLETQSTSEFENHKELQVLYIPNTVKTLPDAINYIGKALQEGRKFMAHQGRITDVCEIHKNIYPAVCRKMEELMASKSK